MDFPKFGPRALMTGSVGMKLLVRLNASIRTSKLKRSTIGKIFASVKSRFQNFGPVKPSYCFGLVRGVKAGRVANTDVSNQRSRVLFSILGSPVTRKALLKRRKPPEFAKYNQLV